MALDTRGTGGSKKSEDELQEQYMLTRVSM
jgi:hypothetical protein